MSIKKLVGALYFPDLPCMNFRESSPGPTGNLRPGLASPPKVCYDAFLIEHNQFHEMNELHGRLICGAGPGVQQERKEA